MSAEEREQIKRDIFSKELIDIRDVMQLLECGYDRAATIVKNINIAFLPDKKARKRGVCHLDHYIAYFNLNKERIYRYKTA